MEEQKRESDFHKESGFITQAKEYLITLEGLPSIHINDIIENERGNQALVTSLSTDHIQALLLDRSIPRANDRFLLREHGIRFSFGDHLFGRVVSALGTSLDGRGDFPKGEEFLKLDKQAPGMGSRDSIVRQLRTGVVLIDTLLPIGKGQRQLIIGPTNSGKGLFLQDVVLNQRDENTICIYALIGKPVTYIREVVARLLGKSGHPKTIVLAATSNEPASVIFMSPSVAFAMAEHFSDKGADVLLVVDDLGTHAKYMREIALLSGKIPGRESYPGDIFYQHAHLMERSGQFNKKHGGGSITLLPVLETNIEDTTDLISTNLMAATDGHIFFSSAIHAEGFYPAVITGQSVTRVGRQTQKKLQQELSIRLQALLAEYEKQREFSRFGAQLSEDTRRTIQEGELLQVLLRQELEQPLPIPAQIILLSLVFSVFCANRDADFLKKNKEVLVETVTKSPKLEEIRKTALRSSISLDQFVKRLNTAAPIFESVCQL